MRNERTTVTLADLNRAMNEDPREMNAEVYAWAVALVEDRLARIPDGAPARRQYEDRLAILRAVARRR